MKTRIKVLIVCSVLFASCSSKTQLSKLWFFTHTNGNVQGNDTLLSPVSFLQLRNDGSYTRDFGRFEYGSWDMGDKQIFLKNQHGKTIRLAFDINKNEMVVRLGNGATANFESHQLPSASENPFSKENNLWRIPPVKKESDEEINARLHNHCQFWETYFKWAVEKDLTRIDVRSTPTLIKIYSNGFELKPYDALPAAWKSYFYDSADCRKANDRMEYIFNHYNIAWGNTDNKFKMFISAFQQLGRRLK